MVASYLLPALPPLDWIFFLFNFFAFISYNYYDNLDKILLIDRHTKVPCATRAQPGNNSREESSRQHRVDVRISFVWSIYGGFETDGNGLVTQFHWCVISKGGFPESLTMLETTTVCSICKGVLEIPDYRHYQLTTYYADAVQMQRNSSILVP